MALTSCPGGTTRLQIDTCACLVSTTPARAFPSRQQQEALLTGKGEGLGVVGDLMQRALRGLASPQAVEVVANTAVAEPLDVDVCVAGGWGFAVEAKELSAP